MPGEEGINSMELINSVILSGRKGKPVTIPVDRDEYEEFIEGLRKTSKSKSMLATQRVTDPQHIH